MTTYRITTLDPGTGRYTPQAGIPEQENT